MQVTFKSHQQYEDLGLVLETDRRSRQVVMSRLEENYGLYEMMLSPAHGSRTTGAISMDTKQPNCHVRFANAPATAIRQTPLLVNALDMYLQDLTILIR